MGLVKNLDHVAVTVSDLDRSLDFYTNVLGFEEMERHRLEGQEISAMAGKPKVIMQVVRLAPPGPPTFCWTCSSISSPRGVSQMPHLAWPTRVIFATA